MIARWLTWFAFAVATSSLAGWCGGQSLEVRFGASGLSQVSYGGQVLTNTDKWPGDTFHIWHMRSTDLNGKPRQDGQYGWGETNRGKVWDAKNHTWIYRFDWGQIEAQYIVSGDSIDLRVTTRNAVGSGIVFDGASITPLVLHPGLPVRTTLNDDLESPAVVSQELTQGAAVSVALADGKPLYSGFVAGKEGDAEWMASGSRPDALPRSMPEVGRSIKPGETDRYMVSLRFAPARTAIATIAADAYRAWTRQWPETLHWTDRRIIGTAYLASSPEGDKNHPHGYAGNPRRYFNDRTLDLANSGAFQERVLKQAETIVTNLKRLNAQGVITWDIEGEEYAQDTSYVCAPDQIAVVAPEMETTVSEGRFRGLKLDDAYFKTIRDAGFRVGVCIRPQKFVLSADGSARQESVDHAEATRQLIRKMRFAHERWGATLFYLDSTVEQDGSTLPASVIESAAAAMPDCLLIPEESSPRMYRSSAPFQTFLFHGDLGTNAEVLTYYPHAFSVNMINDVDPSRLEGHYKDLAEAVRRGDVLMVHVDSWNGNNDRVIELYQPAKR